MIRESCNCKEFMSTIIFLLFILKTDFFGKTLNRRLRRHTFFYVNYKRLNICDQIAGSLWICQRVDVEKGLWFMKSETLKVHYFCVYSILLEIRK